jgi:hypothetical protein
VNFQGRYTDCQITCSGDSSLCSGFKSQLNCDNENSNIPSSPEKVYISGSVSFRSAPFCYTPLYKDGSASFQVNLNVNVNSPQAGKSGSFTMDGSVEQTVMGFSSCYAFLEMMSQAAANQTAQALNQFIQAN